MKRHHPCILFVLLLLLATACGKQDEITSYSVPKQASPAPHADTAKAKPTRMLAAILPDSPQNWFFKMTDSPEQVQAEFEPFVAFLKSLTLKEGKPSWALPENWIAEPGNSMRLATLKVKNSDPPVEVSVIPLPASGNLDQDLLSNINRWRDQVGLSDITAETLKAASDTPALDTELFTVKAGDHTIMVVSLKGEMAGNPMSGAPFASSMMGGGGLPPAGPMTPPAAAASPIKFETPAGWKPGKGGGMRKAAFDIVEGDERGEVTIIDLSKEGNPVLSNVNRWRGQVGLDHITQAQLPEQSETLKAGDLEATYVKLIGPQEAILGAILYRGNLAWFVKYKGSVKLAEQEAERFKQFVQSIRFE